MTDLIPKYHHLDEIYILTNNLDSGSYNNATLIEVLNDINYGITRRDEDPIGYKESFQKLTTIYKGYQKKCDDVISKMKEIKIVLKKCIKNANKEVYNDSLNENIRNINNKKLHQSLAKRSLAKIKQYNMVLPTEQHMIVEDFVNSSSLSSSRKSTKSKSSKTSRGGLNTTRKK
jgi:hypothetical protein